MTAVLKKRRTKSAKRSAATSKVGPPVVTIANIVQWVCAAEQKLEMAYDTADRGEPIDTLLDHINHNVLSGPFSIIHREDLTQGDAKRIYTGLFPVLACLQGAIKLAEGTVLHTTLEEAFALLDAAQTALDPVSQAVRMLPEGGPAYDFERGRDLAIKFINEGRALSGQRDCYRGHRDPGTAQNDFASDYLLQAVDAPEMLGGFAAVLSQVIGSGEGFNGEFFSKLTLAETQAGEIQGVDESSGAVAKVKKLGWQFSESHAILREVIGTMAARLLDHGNLGEVAWGALRLLRTCQADFDAARTLDDYKDISAPLGSALAVLYAANEECDDIVLYGASRLLSLCNESLDGAIGEAA
jgi:hypothetical protein